ncbi:MAG: bifunctional folylpolyglutamate synthase/dihydrofolate synthase [Lachnospiraceae bacterium]|nr:bifunctional folylpolyglutamate synthase/dihydrofolate synthase [Lachnospiraceae bacterium]
MEENLKEPMSYGKTLEYIDHLRSYGVVPGLENMRNLCAKLQEPQDALTFIHIAGTNGKGSILCLLTAALKEAGFRTGSYSSPELVDFRDMIRVNGKALSKAKLCRYMTRIKELCQELVEEGKPHPTLFEVETALAFWHFKELKCDIVVLETGMGGELDATNVVKNTAVAVFSSISPDHIGVLGKNLCEIAWTKSGIIKPGSKVVSDVQQPEVLDEIRERCRQQNTSLTVMDPDGLKRGKSTLKKQVFSYKERKGMEISLAGCYQVENAATALDTLDALSRCGYPVPERAVRKGFLEALWPGRFQVLSQNPLFIADGAHNADAALKLAQSIRYYLDGRKIILIMGVLRDKDRKALIEAVCPLASHILTVSTPGSRGLSACELAGEIKERYQCVSALDSVEEAVEISILMAGAGAAAAVVAFGSLSYLGRLIGAVEKRKPHEGVGKVRKSQNG